VDKARSGSVGGTRGRSFSDTSGSAANARKAIEQKHTTEAINELLGFIGGMMKQNLKFKKGIKEMEG